MKGFFSRGLAFFCTVICATIAFVSLWPAGERVRTDDRNADGRPDVWRHYDVQGQLTEVDIDSNFDGRPDIQEYYERGVLVRRESDRDFDDQIDLVDEFDALTHERVRSVADLDYDGVADVLTLFQDGRPVFSKRVAGPSTNLRRTVDGSARPGLVSRRDDNRLAPLADPFRGDTSVREDHPGPIVHDCVGLSTSGGLPASAIDAVSPTMVSAPIVARVVVRRALADLNSPAPRGPPLS